uniref:Uncharacterized protein n=1 Tax=Knipowitschia caucasica TaxID=637954 RepID=A0AAV2KZI4_KNICA
MVSCVDSANSSCKHEETGACVAGYRGSDSFIKLCLSSEQSRPQQNHNSTTTEPQQHQNRTTTAPEQHQNRTRTEPQQNQNRTTTVPSAEHTFSSRPSLRFFTWPPADMYSSSFSQAKLGLDGKGGPLHRSRGKSCGYYVKLVFFFSSLIQSLIIVSLVLFLVYGQPEKSAEERRVQELEQNFNRLEEINIALRKDKADLGAQLGAKAAEKAAVQKDLEAAKAAANATETELRKKQDLCEKQLISTRNMLGRCSTTPVQPQLLFNPQSSELKTLQSLNAQQKAMIHLIQANFTQMVQYLSQERDEATKDRDTHHQDAIARRRENSLLKEQLTVYARKCKEDFAQSLSGIKTVTSEFLKKITSLFPHQLTFHLSCSSQAEQMEKIRNSCTNLSNDVENKFQIYLDHVGDKVRASGTQAQQYNC